MLTRSSRFLEYMKLHLISLNQDYDQFYDEYRVNSHYNKSKIDNVKGQIKATEHLLSVALDIMEKSEQGEWAINE